MKYKQNVLKTLIWRLTLHDLQWACSHSDVVCNLYSHSIGNLCCLFFINTIFKREANMNVIFSPCSKYSSEINLGYMPTVYHAIYLYVKNIYIFGFSYGNVHKSFWQKYLVIKKNYALFDAFNRVLKSRPKRYIFRRFTFKEKESKNLCFQQLNLTFHSVRVRTCVCVLVFPWIHHQALKEPWVTVNACLHIKLHKTKEKGI